MEESASTHACKINYDDFNMSQRDTVKFRRSYGSVKLNPREGEETVAVDEFGVIIEKIQEVNEDVFLTRECNNFDLINLDSSHSLSSTRCAHLHLDLIERLNRSTNSKDATIHDELNQCCSTIEHEINKVFDREPIKNYSQQIKENMLSSGGASSYNNVNSEEESHSHSSISDRKSDSFIEPFSEPTLTSLCPDNEKPGQKHMKAISHTQDPRNNCRDMKSVRFRDNRDVLTSINFTQNSSSSNDDKSIKCETEEMDSDDSSKWDKKINDTTFNAHYFYNSENHEIEQNATLRDDDIKSDLSEEESASLLVNQHIVTKSEAPSDAANCTRDSFLNDTFDDDSTDSQDTSLSASSTFESAMSSNDMMSPFATPRNSLSKNSSLSGATSTNKKMGIHFASLTSENIPNTLNRISMHKTVEKSILKVPSYNADRIERDSNHNIIGYNKVYSSHSIRKLLNLTSQKRGTDKPRKKDCSNESQLFRKDSQKTISLKTRDKKLNLREFYSSRRNKLKSLVETEKLNQRLVSNSPDEIEMKEESSFQNISIRSSKSVPVRTSKINHGFEGDEKYRFKDESKNIIPVKAPQLRDSKSKFISKIPRPVSRKDVRQKHETFSNFEKCDEDKKHIYHSPTTAHILNSEKSDKSETLSRPSDGSECSYKAVTAKIKDEKTNQKNSSKLIVNNAQIDSLRSKYWMKEDKISFSSVGSALFKKEEKKGNIDNEKKKSKPHAYVPPQPFRQTSRLAYGKMVRVKTAPIKSTLQIREKSIVRELSRPDTAYSLKSGQKPPKVVIIGAVDVNKIL